MGSYVDFWRRALAAGVLAAFCLFGSPAQAAKYLATDAGLYVDNVLQRLKAPAGYAGDVSSSTGFFRVRRAVAIRHGRWGFEPAFWMLLPWRSGRDGFEKTFTFELDGAFTFDLFRFFTLRAGPGLQYQLAVANGENVTLNNGEGTATFYVPGGLSHVFLFTAGAGFELRPFRRLSINGDWWLTNLFGGARRRLQVALSLGVRW